MHTWRARWWTVPVLVLAAALAAALSGGDGGAATVSDGQAVRADQPIASKQSSPSRRDAALRRSGARARRAAQRRSAARRSAAGRAQRVRSRRAYRDRTARAALSDARRLFPAVAAGPLWRPVPLADGQRVVRYLDAHSALLTATADAPAGIVRNDLPLRAPDAQGNLAPVDLTLRDAGDGSLRAANPLVDTEVGAVSGAGLRLPEIDTTIVPQLADRHVPAQLVAGRAFFANVDEDTDLLVRSIPGGLQTFTQLRSPASPDVLALRVRPPAGAVLREVDDGPGGYVVARGDEVLAHIGPPAAVDAAGRAVDVTSRVDGDVLRIGVAHRDAPVTYPVMVDPTYVEDSYQWRDSAAPDFGLWAPEITTTAKFKTLKDNAYLGTGLYVYNRTTQAYALSDYGRWTLEARGYGDAYIYRAAFNQLYHDGMYAETFLDTGIWDRRNARWASGYRDGAGTWVPNAPYTSQTGFYDWRAHPDACVKSDCTAGAVTPGNAAFMQTRVTTAGTRSSFTDFMGGAAVFQSDDVKPVLSAATVPAVWVKSAPSMSATFTDTGLGMHRTTVALDPRRAWTHTTGQPASAEKTATACADTDPDAAKDNSGNRSNPCPKDLAVTFGSGDLPDGPHTVSLTGTDVLGGVTTATRPLKLDNGGPSIALSGPVATNRFVAPGAALKAVATDGTAAAPRSGASRIEIFVDDVRQGDPQPQPCPPGNCTITRDFTLNAPHGEHTIVVKAYDQLGNETVHPAVKVVVDANKPVMTLTGTLKDNDGKVVTGPNYRLQADVVDGTAATPESGTTFLQFTVDGVARPAKTQTCSAGNCTLSDALDFVTANFSEGEHSVLVTARDAVGNQAVQTIRVVVDLQLPVILSTTHTGLPTGWNDGSARPTVAIEARDTGSGVRRMRLYAPGATTQTRDFPSTAAPCDGSVANPCPRTTVSHTFSYSAAAVAEGRNVLRATAEDGAARETEPDSTWTMRVDRSAPVLTLSGSLKNAANTVLVESAYDLTAAGTDGSRTSAGDERSGMKSIEILTRFEDPAVPVAQRVFARRDFVTQTCAAGSCAQTRNWVFRSREYRAGEHTVRAVATDQLGRTSLEDFKVTVGPGLAEPDDRRGLEDFYHYDSVETGGGSRTHVNLTTGNLVWHSTPLINKGRGLSTVANVTYNAQRRTEEAALPYDEAGRNVSVGVSGLTRINEPLDVTRAAVGGPIFLTDPDGSRHQFVARAPSATSGVGEVYIPPAGVNLHLRRYSKGLVAIGPVDEPDRTWAATRTDGVTFFFDGAGYQTSIEDRNGNVMRFEYEYRSATGAVCAVPDPTLGTTETVCRRKLVRVVDPAGVDDPAQAAARSVRLEYHPAGPEDTGASPSGRLASMTDHAGRVLRFEYTDGYLRKYVQASGTAAARSIALDYELADDPDRGGATDPEAFYLKTITDPRAATTHIEYEPRDATGAAPADTFSSRRVESIRDRRDAKTRSADGKDPVDRGVQYWFGDEDDNGTRTTRAEIADGRSTCTLADPSVPRSGTCNVTRATTDAFGRPIDSTDARGAKTVMEWDGDNNLTRLDVAVGTADRAETLMAYNTNGHLIGQTDPKGHRTELTYRDGPGTIRSPRGNDSDAETFVSDLTELITPKGTQTATDNDFQTTFEPDPKGNIRAEIDAEGHRAETDFDARGQIIAERDQMRNATTFSCYDPNGLPRVVANPKSPGGAGADTPNDGRWIYTYDAVGNTTAVTDPRGAGTEACPGKGSTFTSTLTYDELDRVKVERLPKVSRENAYIERTYTYDGNDNLRESKDGTGAIRSAVFNAMDDPEELRSPAVPHAGETTSTSEVIKRTYDGDENLLTEDRPKGSATAEAGDYSTIFRYDAIGQRIAETDRTRGDVDGDGVRDDEDLATGWAYDLRGNVAAAADPKSLQDCNVADPVTGVGQVGCRRWTYVYDRADNALKEIERPGSFAYTTERGYDANDNVETEVDPRGTKTADANDFKTTYLYDDRDFGIGQIDAKGNRTQIDLRPDGKPIADVSARGTATPQAGDFETRYEYYVTGELRSQSVPAAPGQYGPLGRKAVWDRDAVGDALKITDPRGRSFTNTYLDSGELRTTTRPSAFTFDPMEGLEERDITDMGSGGGKPELPSSAAEGDFGKVDPEKLPEWLPKAGPVTIGYDDEIRVTSVAETGAAGTPTARLTRDALGRISESSQPLDLSPVGTADDRYIVNRFGFDANGNAQRMFDGENHMSEVLHDQFDRPRKQDAPGSATAREITLMRYDRNGNVLARQTPRGASYTWNFGYDGLDRLTSSKNPAGDETTFSHDEMGQVKLERSPRGNALPVGHADRPRHEHHSTYNALNQLIETRDGLGHVSTYDYDADGNQKLAIQPGAKADAAATAAEPRVTHREFDGRDRLWSETRGSKADGTKTIHTRTTVTEYDPVGNLVRTVNPAGVDENTRRPLIGWDGGAITATSTATKNATVHEYSDDNVRSSTHLPWGDRDAQDEIRHRQDLALDERGRIKSIDSAYPWSDPNAQKSRTSYTYYDSGWVRSTTDPVLVDSATQQPLKDHVIDYEYDRRGNQTRYLVKDGRRVERTFFGNGLLQRREVRKGDGPVTRSYDYTYNENRSRTSMVDHEMNRTTNIGRDAAERETLTNETWSTGKDTHLTYDRDGNVTRRQTDGRVRTPTPEDSRDYVGGKTTSFVYDAIGREKSMTVTSAAEPTRTLTTDHFPSGEIASRTDGTSGVVESRYFASDGRQTKLKRQKGTATPNKDSAYEYDRNGNRKQDERGTHAYNSRHQLVRWQRPKNADGTDGTAVGYEVNGSGAVTRKDDAGAVTIYKQNGDRLEDVEGAEGSSHYEYDDFGHVKTITGAAAATFTYDDFERMTVSEGGGEKHQYTYDGLDRRDNRTTTKDGASKRSDFSYVGSSESLSQEKDPNDAQSNERFRSYDYDSMGERVGMSMKTGAAAPTSSRYSKDVNGSIEDLEDGTGAKKPGSHYEYDPYGKLLGEAKITDAGALANPFRFEGFYYDSGVKSYDMRARMYKPDVGRFLAQDRFESARGDLNLQSDPLTQNRYAFAGGNPVNRIEFDGHFGLDDIGDAVEDVGDAAEDVGEAAFEAGKYVVGDNPLEIGITVVSIAAAIPTGGASLAAGTALKTAGKTAVKTAAKKATAKKGTQQGAKNAGARPSRCNSFVPGTPVVLADGTSIAIEDVRVGDRVLATHPDTGMTGAFWVTDLIAGEGSKRFVAITAAGRTTVATDEHPYWLVDEGRWVFARNLRPGDVLRRADGTPATVQRVRAFTVAGSRAHNLTVGGAHTYYAGATPVLVHNCPADDAAEEGSRARSKAERDRLQKQGRRGRSTRKRQIKDDDKTPSSIRGWEKQEANRGSSRNPPGKEMGHRRGRDARDGHSHADSPSDYKNKADHKRETSNQASQRARRAREQKSAEGQQQQAPRQNPKRSSGSGSSQKKSGSSGSSGSSSGERPGNASDGQGGSRPT